MSLFNCLHPRIVRDSHGCIRRVRCGHCEACMNQKSMKYSNLCKLESTCHKYCMFVTLTYSNEHLPFVRFSRTNGDMIFFPTTERLRHHLEIHKGTPFFEYCKSSYFKDSTLSQYFSKFLLPDSYRGCIPVLDRYDVQDFLKRFRFNLKKYTNEKIRYYAVGEYGPIHFRPHYHLLVWFDDPQTLSHFGKTLSQSWAFGRCSAELSKGSCANYVSSYANSLSSISRLHSLRAFFPFLLHSTRLSRGFYKSEIKEIYSYEYSVLNSKIYTDNGRVKQVPPTLPLESEFYPRCVNYGSLSSRKRLICYTILRAVREVYGTSPISVLATRIFEDCDGWINALMSSLTFDGHLCENAIKSMLYTSQKFFGLCGDYCLQPSELLTKIESYYKDKDYNNLRNQLTAQEEFSSTCSEDNLCFLLFWYDNFFLHRHSYIYSKCYHMCNGKVFSYSSCDGDVTPSYPKPVADYIRSIDLEPNFVSDFFIHLKDFSLWKDFCTLQYKISSDRVKHKKLNDANKIFCYN